MLHNEQHYPEFPVADWNYSLLSYFHEGDDASTETQKHFMCSMLWVFIQTRVWLAFESKVHLWMSVQVCHDVISGDVFA